MIPYGKQTVNQADVSAVEKVLGSAWLTQGPAVENFEAKLAKYCGAKYAVAVCNGTAALHLAYLVAGLGRGDEVITTPNTFVATTNMMLAVGAKPKFCDIRTDTCNIDEAKIERLINKNTKAIVPVHFAGQPCEMKVVGKIAKRHGLIVIEDACHALGASYGKNKIGSCEYSDMAVFSFHPVKSITTGEGGAILTNDRNFYERLKLLRSHGIAKDKNGFNVMTNLGFNYRITDIQSALGASQLGRLDKFVKLRHDLAVHYRKNLQAEANIILPVELSGLRSSWHLFVIRVKNPTQRQPLANFLKEQGIAVNMHYPAVYRQPFYQSHGYKNTRCPEDELYEKTAITLPLYPLLKKKEIDYICGKIKLFFQK
ncbi:MAG: UDP-4-amino-4,6-dideoxy-N-acetyl-beta-L-altrosamine transaminase [bacterium]|nr:UDP-4-amino-4,6-dideoxy-N-acetyl-beta-L-altrosamine transaminase [bacterium]